MTGFKSVVYTNSVILFSLKIEGNPAICNNMGEPGGHYVKWHKPDTEGRRLHATADIMNLK